MYERSKKGDQKKEPSPNSHDKNSTSKIKIRNNRRELKIFQEISPNTEKIRQARGPYHKGYKLIWSLKIEKGATKTLSGNYSTGNQFSRK